MLQKPIKPDINNLTGIATDTNQKINNLPGIINSQADIIINNLSTLSTKIDNISSTPVIPAKKEYQLNILSQNVQNATMLIYHNGKPYNSLIPFCEGDVTSFKFILNDGYIIDNGVITINGTDINVTNTEVYIYLDDYAAADGNIDIDINIITSLKQNIVTVSYYHTINPLDIEVTYNNLKYINPSKIYVTGKADLKYKVINAHNASLDSLSITANDEDVNMDMVDIYNITGVIPVKDDTHISVNSNYTLSCYNEDYPQDDFLPCHKDNPVLIDMLIADNNTDWQEYKIRHVSNMMMFKFVCDDDGGGNQLDIKIIYTKEDGQTETITTYTNNVTYYFNKFNNTIKPDSTVIIKAKYQKTASHAYDYMVRCCYAPDFAKYYLTKNRLLGSYTITRQSQPQLDNVYDYIALTAEPNIPGMVITAVTNDTINDSPVSNPVANNLVILPPHNYKLAINSNTNYNYTLYALKLK